MNIGDITPEHIIFIPSVLLLGLVIGYTMGARAVRAELEKRKRRMKE